MESKQHQGEILNINPVTESNACLLQTQCSFKSVQLSFEDELLTDTVARKVVAFFKKCQEFDDLELVFDGLKVGNEAELDTEWLDMETIENEQKRRADLFYNKDKCDPQFEFVTILEKPAWALYILAYLPPAKKIRISFTNDNNMTDIDFANELDRAFKKMKIILPVITNTLVITLPADVQICRSVHFAELYSLLPPIKKEYCLKTLAYKFDSAWSIPTIAEEFKRFSRLTGLKIKGFVVFGLDNVI